MAAARPAKIAMSKRPDVAAYSKPDVFDRWNAGIRAASSAENVITIYDVIGEDFWSDGGVTVNRIDAALRRIGNQALEVHLNSPGGDMFEGIAIYNRLQEHPAPITVKVLGLAASAASIIAMAGDTIMMGPASFIMIHNAWVRASGDRHDMVETAAFLTPFDDAMAGVYAARTGQDKPAIAGWMDAETYMGGDLAIERGFADALLSADDLAIDESAGEQASAYNAVRKAELGLCKSMTRTEARGLIAKIKGSQPSQGTPGAARDAGGGAPKPATPGAGDLSWLGAAAELAQVVRA